MLKFLVVVDDGVGIGFRGKAVQSDTREGRGETLKKRALDTAQAKRMVTEANIFGMLFLLIVKPETDGLKALEASAFLGVFWSVEDVFDVSSFVKTLAEARSSAAHVKDRELWGFGFRIFGSYGESSGLRQVSVARPPLQVPDGRKQKQRMLAHV